MDTKEIPSEIKDYIEELLKEAQVVPVSEETKQQMIVELFGELDRFLTAKLIESMPLEQMDAFLEIQKENNPDKLGDFLERNLPNVEELYTQAFAEFGTMYVSSVAKAREQQEKHE